MTRRKIRKLFMAGGMQRNEARKAAAQIPDDYRSFPPSAFIGFAVFERAILYGIPARRKAVGLISDDLNCIVDTLEMNNGGIL